MSAIWIFQLFDDAGRPQLAGQSPISDYSDWLMLSTSSWGPDDELPYLVHGRGSKQAMPALFINKPPPDLNISYEALASVDRTLYQAATAATYFSSAVIRAYGELESDPHNRLTGQVEMTGVMVTKYAQRDQSGRRATFGSKTVAITYRGHDKLDHRPIVLKHG